MISPTPPRSIDSSMVLFIVLVACAAAGLYCAFHFGSVSEVERALIILRERPDDPQPKYPAFVIASGTNRTPAKTGPLKHRSHSPPR
jgi:hypothetical protein